VGSDRVSADHDLHRVSGEFVDAGVESSFRAQHLGDHLGLYRLVARVIAVGFASFAVLDLASLGPGAEFASLLVARLACAALVWWTGSRMGTRPERFATTDGLNLIATTQVMLYLVVLLACALRPQDAATNAVSVAVLVLGALVLVPGRFAVQVTLGVLMAAGFTAVAVLGPGEPVLATGPLLANLLVAVSWGATIRRMSNRDSRRRWAAVRDVQCINERLAQELAASDDLRAELQTLARQDPLTCAANRRELVRAAEELLADRRTPDVSLLLMDADRFKSINDHYGHAAGDAALVALADATRAAVRAQDLVARVGGEEFAVLLPSMQQTAAASTAERVCRSIEDAGARLDPPLPLSVSIGVATARPGDTVEQLLARADRAMYRVKADGGNAVALADRVLDQAEAR
jgi:diguanylate cyclase (GGDEF)-like protein